MPRRGGKRGLSRRHAAATNRWFGIRGIVRAVFPARGFFGSIPARFSPFATKPGPRQSAGGGEMNLFEAIFGTKHARDVKRLRPVVARINEWDEKFKALSDAELQAKTAEFKERFRAATTGKSAVTPAAALDALLPEAFAAVKNACRRLVGTKCTVCGHELEWDMVPFDVQLMGGIVLHQGKIAEMQTGEGKTLVATAPLYLNALAGENVQLVTVNDYLALRDSQWMGHLYKWLGLTVGCIQNSMTPAQRREQYACDITYGTNSEFGFDYLRDNGMAQDVREQVQRGHAFAIVDEVDSILIDEARTPLIISGPAEYSSNQYRELQPQVEKLYRRQEKQVSGLVADARKALSSGETARAQKLLYQIYHGMPKNKEFMAMLEDPAVRKVHEDVEAMMLTDMHKDEAREFREELFFTVDEKMRDASLTDRGCAELNPSDPEMFVVPDIIGAMAEIDREGLPREERDRRRVEVQKRFAERSERIQNVAQLLKAYCLYEKDVEYVVQNDKVLIVDEFTGRILPGRRWSDGLHQAVEAKEHVAIERETQTLATITIQNYFRMYKKLSGMTGTAETEASEFNDIYRLDVVAIPTNRPIRRIDRNDLMFRTQREKYQAIIEDVAECHKAGQPVLIGTVSVETSEILSRLFDKAGIRHNVLNAKNHAREAEIVALAGQKGAVTIATNMAGRGTDIKLGEGVVWTPKELIRSQTSLDEKPAGETKTLRQLLEERPCGLYVIGSERHESRRIDRQLRGRCARQGDPGASRFYVSLEDNLMRLFGSDRIAGIMTRLGMQEGEPIEHRWLNHSIESAQRRVEERNFSVRKRTLEYDDVMNRQRAVVYDFRTDVLRKEDVHGLALDILHDLVLTQAEDLLSDSKTAQAADFADWAARTFPVPVTEADVKPFAGQPEKAAEFVYKQVEDAYELKCSLEDPQVLPRLERYVALRAIDREWQDYLRSMDELRDSVRLRAYGQRDPLVEYKREAYGMFERLMNSIKTRAATGFFRASTSVDSMRAFMAQLQRPRRVTLTSPDANASLLQNAARAAAPAQRVQAPPAGSAE
ncbi:MAG: preprotein translocase subunit SecA, partial [Kiritimatiellae bacterium]|nr:preprotein translocase subunit SecA [Kiritimatiellia bacterium]